MRFRYGATALPALLLIACGIKGPAQDEPPNKGLGDRSTDPAVSPKVFDHTPTADTGQGPTVPGIYELGGGVLKISLLPPKSDPRPTRFESKAANGSRMYIFKRVVG